MNPEEGGVGSSGHLVWDCSQSQMVHRDPAENEVRSEMEREPLTWMNEIERVVRLHESFGEELLKEWPVWVIVPLL